MRIKSISSPNIALIKYWGKKESGRDEDRNIGLNPSLSLTLSKAQTEVLTEPSDQTEFIIAGQIAKEKDQVKLTEHLARVEKFLGKAIGPLRVRSQNNFPTGTGIASSASAYSGLTCAFLAHALGVKSFEKLLQDNPQAVADLARRGSGSACRSLHGPFVKWDEKTIRPIASPWKLFDTIVIFSSVEKKVSSTDGHAFATQSPLFPGRLKNLPKRTSYLERAINERDLRMLGRLMEEEAIEMHEIMRQNPHPVEYQTEETKKFLAHVQNLEKRNFYFTLDAGPNAHLLSETPIADQVQAILDSLGIKAEIWQDETGYGPRVTEL